MKTHARRESGSSSIKKNSRQRRLPPRSNLQELTVARVRAACQGSIFESCKGARLQSSGGFCGNPSTLRLCTTATWGPRRESPIHARADFPPDGPRQRANQGGKPTKTAPKLPAPSSQSANAYMINFGAKQIRMAGDSAAFKAHSLLAYFFAR